MTQPDLVSLSLHMVGNGIHKIMQLNFYFQFKDKKHTLQQSVAVEYALPSNKI